MIFWRTHWAWSAEWEEWDSDKWNPRTDARGGWRWRSRNHFGDYETAMAEYDRLTDLPPGQVRNVRVNRRPVGAPMNFLRSS